MKPQPNFDLFNKMNVAFEPPSLVQTELLNKNYIS